MALLEFLLAAAGAGIVAANIFQRIARRLLGSMIAVRAMNVAMVVVVMIVVMVVVAIGTVHVGLLGHRGDSAVSRLAGIISPRMGM